MYYHVLQCNAMTMLFVGVLLLSLVATVVETLAEVY